MGLIPHGNLFREILYPAGIYFEGLFRALLMTFRIMSKGFESLTFPLTSLHIWCGSSHCRAFFKLSTPPVFAVSRAYRLLLPLEVKEFLPGLTSTQGDLHNRLGMAHQVHCQRGLPPPTADESAERNKAVDTWRNHKIYIYMVIFLQY